MIKRSIAIALCFGGLSLLQAQGGDGKKVFETYCWGCHHQSAEAFGPSFTQIASRRNADQIRAMITDSESVSKVLGYSRNAMPKFQLSEDELNAITSYILSFKPKSKEGK
jgi:mono/diheme cytochrome c family protein